MMGLLERRDLQVIGLGIVLSAITAVLAQYGIYTFEHEIMLDYLEAVPLLLGVVFIYRARHLWGGEIARCMELVGIGLAIHMLIWIPHLRWHLIGLEQQQLPAWIGLDPSFWYVFFHTVSLFGFVLVAYGFYLFWHAGQE